MTIESQRDAAANDSAADVGEYRILNLWAVVALVLGLASAGAFAHPVLWIVPLLGLSASLLSLRQIAIEAPDVTGRKAALWGLGLSIAFGLGAVCDRAATKWWVEHEATAFARLWFDHLQHDQPHLALQLAMEPERRRTDNVLEYYQGQPEARIELEKFVANKPVRAILALGEQANIRLYNTELIEQDHRGRYVVGQTYAVTYDSSGSLTTFLVHLGLKRSLDYQTKAPRWEITGWKGDVKLEP